MSFDLDDPLGDLLSDGSNDSFFADVQKKKTEHQAKTSSPGKNTLDELFGIKEVEKPLFEEPGSLTKSSIAPAKEKLSTPKKNQVTNTKNEGLDVFPDFGFDPKKPKSKTNVLDDILGITESKPRPMTAIISTSKEDIPRPRTVPREDTPKSTPKLPSKMSRQSTVTSETTNTTNSTSENTIFIPARKQTRRQSSLMDVDPLGLFAKSEQKSELMFESKHELAIAEKPNLAAHAESHSKKIDTNVLDISVSQTEQAISMLKTKEVQLTVASQMKSQEAALTDIQERQKVLLQQQEAQFNDLVQKQLQRQRQLEETVKLQQERINSHIQLLMSSSLQPPSESNVAKNDQDMNAKQLELEKLRLVDLISNMNSNHEQEIMFLEQSHKKQITLLEENLIKTEGRLKAENKSLQEFYFAKIADLENEKQHLQEDSKSKMEEMKEEYEKTIIELKRRHHDDLMKMEREYKEMVVNIRQSKLYEFAMIQENTSYLDTLKGAYQTIENAHESLNEVKDLLITKIDDVYASKEADISKKEQKLEALEKKLTKAKESQEDERKQLLNLIKTLEMKLSSVEQENNEEKWKTQQKQISIEVEKVAFEREKTFFRDQMNREQKWAEDQKHLQAIDYDRQVKQIEEERMNLLTEKAKMETNARLQKKSDNTITRAEIEAAIKVAEDTRLNADTERERLIDAQKQCEQKRKELLQKENTLRSKQVEMEEAINQAKTMEERAEKTYDDAKILEQGVLKKLLMFQRHAREVKERETEISRAKICLSKERMELETLRKKLTSHQCSLCKLGANNENMTHFTIGDAQADQIDAEIDNSLSRIRADADTVETNLDNIPNLLDSDLLLLKLDVLNSMQTKITKTTSTFPDEY